jgi:hypothetical protein
MRGYTRDLRDACATRTIVGMHLRGVASFWRTTCKGVLAARYDECALAQDTVMLLGGTMR